MDVSQRVCVIDTCPRRSYNPSMTKQLASVSTFVVGSVLITFGCISTPNVTSNAKDAPIAVKSQLASGAPIYAQTCATSACHGTQGEGIRSGNGFSAWPLVGDEFQSRHPNAQIAFDVIRSGDEPNLRALTDQQIYDAIAYELSQNQIALKSPLTADNAFAIYGGSMSGQTQGGLFPPSDNVVINTTPHTWGLPIITESPKLRIQIDQIVEARAIGNAKATFLIFVIVFSDLDDQPITVSPNHLSLSTPSGDILQPQSINIHSAIEKFHKQTIKPQYGTAALVIFMLSAPEQFSQLIYDDQTGNRLTSTLKP